MSARFTRQQIEWTRQVRDDLKLPDLAVRIADALAFDYMNEAKGAAWPSIETLEERIGKSEKSLNTAIAKMIERGHLKKISGGGAGKSNRYLWILKAENSGKNAGVSGRETPAFSKEFSSDEPRQKRKGNSGTFGAKTPEKMPEEPFEGTVLKGAAANGFENQGALKQNPTATNKEAEQREISPSRSPASGGEAPAAGAAPAYEGRLVEVQDAKDATMQWVWDNYALGSNHVDDLIYGFGPNASSDAREDASAVLVEALDSLPINVAAMKMDQYTRVALNLLRELYGDFPNLRRDVDDLGRAVMSQLEQKGARHVG